MNIKNSIVIIFTHAKSLGLLFRWLIQRIKQYRRPILVTLLLFYIVFVLLFITIPRHMSQNEYGRLNPNNIEYAHASIALDDFVFTNKELHARMRYWVDDNITEIFPESEIPFRIELPQEYIGKIYKANPHERSVRITFYGTIVEKVQFQQPYDTREFQIPFRGDESLFPFDSYKAIVGVSIPITDDLLFENTQYPLTKFPFPKIPFAFTISDNIKGYRMSFEPIDNSEFSITVYRSLFDQIISVISVVILCIIGIYFIYLSTTSRKYDVSIVISGAALLIAIPSLRSALVPSQISVKTILDFALIVPLSMFICGGIVIIIRNWDNLVGKWFSKKK